MKSASRAALAMLALSLALNPGIWAQTGATPDLAPLSGGPANPPSPDSASSPISAASDATDIRQLTIEEALDLAAANADSVKARGAALDAALGALDEARASFMPKISASASGAWLANPPKGLTVTKGELGSMTLSGPSTAYFPSQDTTFIADAKDTYFKGNITLAQPLFTWGKVVASSNLAAAKAETALAERDGSERDARRQTEDAYFAARLCGDSLEILSQLRDMAASIVADRASAQEAGMATQEQLLSSKADLADLEARIVETGEARHSALQALGLLTGLDPRSIQPISDYRAKLPSLDEGELQDRAARLSTGPSGARSRLAEAGRQLDLAKGASMLLPNLALFASLDVSGQAIPLSSSSWTDTWSWDLSLGLSVKTDLFDGGSSWARIREAEAGREAAGAALSGAEGAARLALRKAMDAARRAEADLSRKEARAAWAAESLRAAGSSFDNQLISRGEYNGAKIREAAARLDLIQARYALEESLAEIELHAARSLR